MGNHEFPRAAEIETAFRAAHRALEAACAPGTVAPENNLEFAEVLSKFPSVLD